MASVVFLRGVNVGGHRTFQPSVLAKELADFGVVNVGAAGTFVVRKPISQSTLRAELVRRLPFEPEMMICTAGVLIELANGNAFPDELPNKNARRFVSVMAKRPKSLPALPLCQPDDDQWQVQVVGISGKFALSLHRRMGPRLIYPNEVVEKRLGVAATTRNWDTVAAICDILKSRT